MGHPQNSDAWQPGATGDIRSSQQYPWQTFAEKSLAGVAVLDAEHFRIRWANRRFRGLLGLTGQGDELCGRSLSELLPLAADRLVVIFREVVATGQPFEATECRIDGLPNGPARWQCSIMPLATPSGPPDLFFQAIPATSEGHHQAADKHWERAFDSVPDLIAILDRDHRIVRVNEAMARRLGLMPEQCVGQFCYKAVHGLDAPPDFCPHSKAVADGQEHTTEMHEERVKGDFFVSVTPLRDEDGRITGSVHVARDITERKRAEAALRQSEEQVQSLSRFPLENPHPVLRIDHQGTIRFANAASKPLLRSWEREVGQTLPAPWREEVKAALDEKRIRELDVVCGEEVFSCVLAPVPTEKYVNLYGRNITRRMQAERALREANRLLDTILNTTHLLIACMDRDFNFLLVNQAYARADNREPSFFAGKNHFDLYPDAENEAIFRQVVETGEPAYHYAKPFEYQEHPERGVSYWDWGLLPIKDSSGALRGLVLTLLDVTQRVKAEEALRRHEERQRLVFDALPSAIFAKDLEGRYLLVNRTACEWGSWSRDEILGKTDFDLFPPEVAKRLQEKDKRAIEAGRTVESEEYAPRGNEYRTYLIHRFPLTDAGGVPYALCGIATDITERKRSADELEQAKLAAEAASLAKSQFLANISHELRTPMNAILGMTELALGEELTPPLRDCLQTAKDAADALLVLLNDLLDFSGIETAGFSVHAKPFRLRELLSDTLKLMEFSAHQKGLRLTSEIPNSIPNEVLGDPGRLRQVLTNLLGNAIKFTDSGKVAVTARLVALVANQVEIEFAVVDTGIGISPEDCEKVFQPFTQVDPTLTRPYGGAGLGLAIAANLVALMGGRIWVESTPGRGSSFYFTTRLGVQSEATTLVAVSAPRSIERIGTESDVRPLRVLLVEDTPANQKLAQRMLEKRGHRVEVACDGAEAVRMYQHGRFDVVLMDIQMPVMDGFQATAAIRAMQREGKPKVPIIAMTAHAMKGDEERCLAAGMDAYLAKPISSSALNGLVESLGRRNRAEDG